MCHERPRPIYVVVLTVAAALTLVACDNATSPTAPLTTPEVASVAPLSSAIGVAAPTGGAYSQGNSPQFFPFDALVSNCAEDVFVEGFFHPVFKFRIDASGRVHFKGHFNASGTGTGLTTGATYNWNDAINEEGNFTGPQETYSFQQAFELIGRGGAPNLRVRAQFHVTVTPNGVENITVDNFTVTCP